MRILVTGGRFFADERFLIEALDYLHARRRITVVIHGACMRLDKHGREIGADYFAGRWCRRNYLFELPFPADWDRLGDAAGPIRNDRMLEEGRPEGAVAFPGALGTKDMVKKCWFASVKVWKPAEDQKFLAWRRSLPQ